MKDRAVPVLVTCAEARRLLVQHVNILVLWRPNMERVSHDPDSDPAVVTVFE